jgi:hypothetical protein
MRMLTVLVLVQLAWGATAALAAPAATPGNDLQRAAWACEGAAPALAAARGQRFFLGTVDASAAQHIAPPLVLAGTRLSGAGSLSGNAGWFNIRFSCQLSPDLAKATAFSFQKVSPSAAAPPPMSNTPITPAKRWSADARSISFGVPETDDIDFDASCAKGVTTVYLQRTVAALKQGGFVTVSLTAGGFSGLYVAKGVMSEEAGVYLPQFPLPAGDGLADAMARGQSLHINIGGDTAYDLPLKGGSAVLSRFAAACGHR